MIITNIPPTIIMNIMYENQKVCLKIPVDIATEILDKISVIAIDIGCFNIMNEVDRTKFINIIEFMQRIV